jgi:hypothetical protein
VGHGIISTFARDWALRSAAWRSCQLAKDGEASEARGLGREIPANESREAVHMRRTAGALLCVVVLAAASTAWAQALAPTAPEEVQG